MCLRARSLSVGLLQRPCLFLNSWQARVYIIRALCPLKRNWEWRCVFELFSCSRIHKTRTGLTWWLQTTNRTLPRPMFWERNCCDKCLVIQTPHKLRPVVVFLSETELLSVHVQFRSREHLYLESRKPDANVYWLSSFSTILKHLSRTSGEFKLAHERDHVCLVLLKTDLQ
jgi:hypothetical protein